jgi:hypothetical protein
MVVEKTEVLIVVSFLGVLDALEDYSSELLVG